MGRNAKLRREIRDAEQAATGGRTRHQVNPRTLPLPERSGGKISPSAAALLVAGMLMFGAVSRGR